MTPYNPVCQLSTPSEDETRGSETYRLGVDVDVDARVGHRVRAGELDEVLARGLRGAGALQPQRGQSVHTPVVVCGARRHGRLTVTISWAHSG